MIVPADKYLLQDYREALKVADSPQDIDTKNPITPVVVLNAGLPKPTARQIVHTAFINCTAAASNLQIASVNSTSNIYFVSAFRNGTATKDRNMYIYDAITGSAPTTTGDTVITDDSFWNSTTIAGSSNNKLPKLCKNGIRFHIDALAGAGDFILVEYIEELK